MVVLRWDVDNESNMFTTLSIQQCNKLLHCLLHDITNITDKALSVSLHDGTSFHLVVYQGGLKAYRSEEFAERDDETDNLYQVIDVLWFEFVL